LDIDIQYKSYKNMLRTHTAFWWQELLILINLVVTQLMSFSGKVWQYCFTFNNFSVIRAFWVEATTSPTSSQPPANGSATTTARARLVVILKVLK